MHTVQQAMFRKNLSMLGGALLISYFGAGPIGLDARQAARFRLAPEACVPPPPGSIFDMAITKGWPGTATNAVGELTGQRATSVAEFLAEHIDVVIEAAEPPLAFASNRSR